MNQNTFKYLLDERGEIKHQLDKCTKPKDKGFYTSRLKQLNERIAKFGQRYSIVQVTITYLNDNTPVTQFIYYTGIAESDAIEYTRALMEPTLGKMTIGALTIPSGRLLNKVL